MFGRWKKPGGCLMDPDSQRPKNLVRLCPLLSSAITYERQGPDGKRVRVHELARSPCIRGDCEFFDIGTTSCIFKRAKP
jgi:hypothetical protein